jgi:hypothetical protein
MTCPVVETIQQIYGSGAFEDEDDVGTVKLGGSDVEYVMNEMGYYMMLRRIELARFELSKPTPEACAAKYKKMFSGMVGMTYSQLRVRLIDDVLGPHMYNQFIKIVDLIGQLEELIVARADTYAKTGRAVNISLPDIIWSPHIDRLIMYDPSALEYAMGRLVDYMNKLNVNSMLKTPISARIPPPPKMATTAALSDTAQTIVGGPRVCTLDAMKEVLEQEMEVAQYVREIEKYHCRVLAYSGTIYDFCASIVADLS